MSARLSLVAFSAITGLLVAWSSPAAAQAWLSDRSRAEGIGIRAGNLELHPGIGAELGYDSNVFLRNANREGSAILRVTPHLFVSTLGGERTDSDPSDAPKPVVDFRFGGSLPVLWYFDTERRTRVEANADLALQLLPERPVSLVLNAQYNRTSRPFANGPEGVSYGRNTLNVAPGLAFQTVGGVLRAGIGGTFAYDFFDATSFGLYDSKSYGATANASWEFLPKTALVYEAAATFRDYDADAGVVAAGSSGDGSAQRSDSSRWMFRAGVNGALSARISATLLAGYTASFFRAGDDADSPTLSADLRWKPSETITTSLGYDRTLTTAFQGNFHTNDRVGLKLEILAGGAFLMSANAYYAYVKYGNDTRVDGNGPRVDNRVGGELSGEYRFADWVAVTAHTSLTTNMSDSRLRAPDATSAEIPLNFTRFDAFGGLRIFY